MKAPIKDLLQQKVTGGEQKIILDPAETSETDELDPKFDEFNARKRVIPEILNVYDMNETSSLSRFLEAQQKTYKEALKEIKSGRKRSHWMWYIFPQILGLGFTDTSKYYAIKDLDEASDYLNHPVLGRRLTEISRSLLEQDTRDANLIFGSPDDLKLKSSMTLFSIVPNADPVFEHVLKAFFADQKDQKTLQLLGP